MPPFDVMWNGRWLPPGSAAIRCAALRARLLAAESDRRQGRAGAAAGLLSRLARVSTSCPEIVRARIALLRDLLTPAETTAVIERHVSATGLQALRLFAPGYLDGDAAGRRVGLDDALAVLTICQSVEEEGAALVAVCARVRRGLRAAGVGFVVPRGKGTIIPACDGGRIDTSVAERALALDHAMAPHPHGEGVAACTPIRYGGRTIGAIVARWSAGAAVDVAKASTVLTMAAAAAAPSLASLSGRLGAAAGFPTRFSASARPWRTCAGRSTARPRRRFRCWSRVRAAAARNWWLVPSTSRASAASAPSAPSTARRCPTTWSRPSCSGMFVARSPVQ